MNTTVSLSGLRRGCAILVAATLGITFAVQAEAGPERARLSRDLAQRIAAGDQTTTGVIVRGGQELIETLATRYGARIRKHLRGGAVLEVTGGQLDALSQDPDVDHLSGDVPVRRMMAVTTESIGADQAWRGFEGVAGVTGKGIGVAIIDSGVAVHRDLAGRVVADVDFTDSLAREGNDGYGHGTHVAGIIAGSGSSYAGVAPGANIINLRAIGADGTGTTSNVIAAIDWAVDNRARYNIRVINLSLGHPVFESYRDDPLCQAVQRAAEAGILVVAAAGNFGKTDDGRPVVGGIVSPGNSPAALTVGALNTKGTAVRSDDVMATYSSRGPTAIDGVIKPELAAPGNRLVATAAHRSTLAQAHPDRVVTGAGAASYMEMSGTSMAAAVVSGAAALLLEAKPELAPADLKLVLQLTSSRVAGAGLLEAGAGSVNVAAALGMVRQGRTGVTEISGEPHILSGILIAPSNDSVARAPGDPRALAWSALAPNSMLFTPGEVTTDGIAWVNGIVWTDGIAWVNGTVWEDGVDLAD